MQFGAIFHATQAIHSHQEFAAEPLDREVREAVFLG